MKKESCLFQTINMKVLKFGGTSIGTAERMKSLLPIISTDNQQIIVLSAVSGVTNILVSINKALKEQEKAEANELSNKLQEIYHEYIESLFVKTKSKSQAFELIDSYFELLKTLFTQEFSERLEKKILTQGELVSTSLFHAYLTEQDVPSVLIPALDFMKLNEENEPTVLDIKKSLSTYLELNKDINVFITQGFICSNSKGEDDNLKRGGSDYTATLIGAAIGAEEVQIWTDINGMHNNDPRIVQGTKPIAHLCFDEAAELAYFGAKVLHPQSIFPARKHQVPVRILNTMDPRSPGTVIDIEQPLKNSIRAIAAKDDIIAIRIHSSRMLMAYGFLRKIFEIFERYKTPIDLITTSEVAISLTIDSDKYLNKIVDEIQELGSVEIDRNQTIVCVVGDFTWEQHGFAAKVLEAVKHLSVRMISYGGSSYNISLLIDTNDKVDALNSLHQKLF